MKHGAPISLWLAFLSVIATASSRWLGGAEGFTANAAALDNFEVWRLLSGPLVHATGGHLLRDLALLLFVGIAFEREFGRRYSLLCVLGLVVPTIAALADPSIDVYYGTSGLTHALLAAALTHTLFVRHPDFETPDWMRSLAALGALALLMKVAWELSSNGPLFPMDLGAGVRQLPSAHAAGALTGVLFVALTLLIDRARRDSYAERGEITG